MWTLVISEGRVRVLPKIYVDPTLLNMFSFLSSPPLTIIYPSLLQSISLIGCDEWANIVINPKFVPDSCLINPIPSPTSTSAVGLLYSIALSVRDSGLLVS